ncbi:Phospholipase/carboxylesterase/thioesterase [Truncatella angustata]|uniref:Acyl-protein thioesterase 1 n=1 Tax=Truncatella angustata TaxID=152316 RepID=A0A9P8ZVA5_9PEZI|nr:Phospholipase/carboxylesterase/thioesterase [Truncatella angustata]KAH6648773.1 Phospholipase/carboxylesterase/thioesterase [Truncatella angustata]KAH8201188.1 hypothetical protein TruAng_004656 [Truncatella angustata]
MSGALQRLAPLLFPPAGRHTATVIFVHGLGDTGHGWADAVQNWRRRSKLNEVKFILPHAPRIPITCNMGMEMPGWYDIVALSGSPDDLRRQQDEAGMLISRAYLSGLIQAEIDNGVPSERIVLGGFSQGGAMSLFTGLTTKFKLAGIVGMSSYLPLDTKLPEFLNEANFNQKTPILMCHGNMDQVVPYVVGKGSYDLLKKTGFDVTWKEYDGMGHSACLEEINEVESFLVRQLPLQGEEKKSEL